MSLNGNNNNENSNPKPKDKEKEIQEDRREYQTILSDIAIKENAIVCLPTGSGKTFVAVSVIQEFLKTARRDKKRIIFLANKVHLVHQQGKYIEQRVGVGENDFVSIITGDMNTDDWKRQDWDNVTKKSYVLVMSTEIFKQALWAAYLKWADIALLVLDECHHATKKDPMSLVIDKYNESYHDKDFPRADLPRVLGLTATIINDGASNIDWIPNDIFMIEHKFCSRVVTHTNPDELKGYSTSARVEIKLFGSGFILVKMDIEKFTLCLENAKKSLAKIPSLNNKPYQPGVINHPSFRPENLFYSGKTKGKIFTALLDDVILAFKELGAYCARLVAKFNLQFLQTNLIGCTWHSKDEQKGGKIVATALEEFMRAMDKEFKNLPPPFLLATYISRKLDELIKILKKWNQGLAQKQKEKSSTQDSELCGIVFVKKRLTASVLHWYFKDVKQHSPKGFEFLNTDFVVGCENSHWGMNYENMHFTAVRQNNVLSKFRQNEINLIFSTSVLEEGLDVRNCGLGIRFDPIENYPSFVQSMGRVRQQNAPFYVMVESKDQEKETNRLNKFITYHAALQRFMVQKSIRPEDYDAKVKNQNLEAAILKSDHGIQPFCPGGPNSPMVTMETAIQLVYRYCATLPCDKLSPLYPFSWSQKMGDNDNYKAYIQFPSNSVITDVIEGPVVKGKQLAKQAVHLAACKLLYERQALDDHLEPITAEVPLSAKEFMEIYNEEKKKEEAVAPGKVGTQKRTQWYPKKGPSLPSIFGNTQQQQAVYLIKFIRKVDHQEPFDVYNLKGKRFAFGILTCAQLGYLPEFSLLGRFGSGCETMTVQLRRITIPGGPFSNDQIKMLNSMQNQIFEELLHLKHPLFCQATDTTSLIAIPLRSNDTKNQNYEVFWEFPQKLEFLKSHEFLKNPPSFVNKTNKVFDPKIYEDTVIMRCGRKSYETIKATDLFCIIGYDPNETSFSIMNPNTKQPKTYLEHYASSPDLCNIKILNPKFPMLQAKQLGMGNNLNFLSTKYKKNFKRRKVPSKTAFPPDLVFITPIPASLLTQATLLPSTLHRISRMLLSREIQLSLGETFPDWKSVSFQWCGVSHVTPDTRVSALEITADSPDDSTSSSSGNESMEIEDGEIEEIDEPEHEPEPAMSFPDLNILAPIAQECIHPDEMTPELMARFKALVNKRTTTPTNKLNRFKREHGKDLSSLESLSKRFKPFEPPMSISGIVSPCPFDIMEALTLANAEDSLSMERLEFIGDSVLKLFCSLHIFFHFPKANEGQMTCLRNTLVSNAYLYLCAKKKNLGEYISGGIFQPDRTWMHPGAILFQNIGDVAANYGINLDCFAKMSREELSACSAEELNSRIEDWISRAEYPKMDNTTYSHTRIGDKNIADSVESLIGCYYTRGGLPGALRFMEWIDLKAPTQNGQIINYGVIPEWSTLNGSTKGNASNVDVSEYVIGVDELEDLISYKFKNRLLILEAFSYPNYTKNSMTGCYQRLEFLGDAVLDFLIANHIYTEGKDKTPGELTCLKSALVNNFTLASLSVKYGFEKRLLSFGSKAFQDSIDKFIAYQDQNGHSITGILPLKNQREWADPKIAESIPVPKVLGDIFESLVGAVYIDSGRSLDTTRKIVYRLMEKEITSFSQKIPKNVIATLGERFPNDNQRPIFTVEETCKENMSYHTTTVVKLTIPGISDEFRARGINKKEAKQAAAQWALKQLSSTTGKAKRATV